MPSNQAQPLVIPPKTLPKINQKKLGQSQELVAKSTPIKSPQSTISKIKSTGLKSASVGKTTKSSVTKSPTSPQATQPSQSILSRHSIFWSLLILSLVLWVAYRALFSFPVWFDETIGKALFFGLPAWIYVVVTNFKQVGRSFSSAQLEKGLLLGLAIGGVYGFVTAILSLLQSGSTVAAAPLFASQAFWYEFGLAIFTGFWETLFFFSWIGSAIFALYKHWTLPSQVIVISGIFLIFHLPNIILRFSGAGEWGMVLMLFLFALGQTMLFFEYKNSYALILSQAIWGMVLLVYGT